MSLRVVVSTSDRYHHLLPVFFYLYGCYWNAPFDLVGYAKPSCPLPDNCTWVSLGEQGPVNEWSTDLRRYFESIKEDQFVWLFEDTLIRSFDNSVDHIKLSENVGRICLTDDTKKREHYSDGWFVHASPTSRYRLSTQPSIWNKKYLLQYLNPGLNCWDFETQDPINDGWDILGYVNPPLVSNEGVRRFGIRKLNLDGICEDDKNYINKIVATW